MLEVREDGDGLTIVRHADCPDELADFIEGCVEWLRKFGPISQLWSKTPN